MSYVITGAAGNLGRRTAELMLQRVDAADVVLVTRRPDELADLAGRGADVRRADFDSPESLAPAFAGGDRLLLISTDVVGERVPGHLAAIDAAAAAGVRHVAYRSIPNPTDANPAGVAPDHRAAEEHPGGDEHFGKAYDITEPATASGLGYVRHGLAEISHALGARDPLVTSARGPGYRRHPGAGISHRLGGARPA